MATKTRGSKRWKTSATPEQVEAKAAERREAGKAKAKAALERLDSAIERIIESDEAFAEYLRLSGKMHGYSFGNRLLIWVQRRDAGMVAGFHRWLELGRPVRKGAKGIQILAPMAIKREAGTDHAGEMVSVGNSFARVQDDGTYTAVVGFRVSYVFSIHDTDGPDVSIPKPVTVDDDSERAQTLGRALLSQAEQAGCKVSFQDIEGSAGGWYDPRTAAIVVRSGQPAGDTCHTLIHELAHHYAHKADKSYADGEVVAESAAFVVASHYGLDTSGYSAPYVAGWAKGDVKRFRGLLDRIMKVSADLINDGETCPRCLGEGCEECR